MFESGRVPVSKLTLFGIVDFSSWPCIPESITLDQIRQPRDTLVFVVIRGPVVRGARWGIEISARDRPRRAGQVQFVLLAFAQPSLGIAVRPKLALRHILSASHLHSDSQDVASTDRA